MTKITVHDLLLSKPVKDTTDGSRITILKGVNAVFESGKLNAIMGPNGCGKTTFLNILYGYHDKYTYTSGLILLDDQERDIDHWFENVSYIEQESYEILNQTAASVIQFAIDMKNAETGKNTQLSDFTWMFEELYIADLLEKNVSVLSGGERQRVLVATELVLSKSIIMLDEPTSDLDSHLALNVVHFLKRLAVEQDIMVIFTIHQPSDQIFKLFDNLLFMGDGKIIYDGPAQSLESNLASAGILKPEEWSISEFIFEAFYGESDFEEVQQMKTQVDIYKQKVDEKSDELLKNAQLSKKETKDYVNSYINFRKVYHIAVRRIKTFTKGVYITMTLMTLLFPTLGLIADKVSNSEIMIKTQLAKKEKLAEIVTWLSDTNAMVKHIIKTPIIFIATVYCIFALSMQLTSIAEFTTDETTQSINEIRKSFYTPFTLGIATNVTDVFLSILMFSSLYLFFLSIGVALDLSMLFWMAVCLHFIGSFIVGRFFYNFFSISTILVFILKIFSGYIMQAHSLIAFLCIFIANIDVFNTIKINSIILVMLQCICVVLPLISPICYILCLIYVNADLIPGLIKISDTLSEDDSLGYDSMKKDDILYILISPKNYIILKELNSRMANFVFAGLDLNKYMCLLGFLVSCSLIIYLNLKTYNKKFSPAISLKV